MDNASSATVDDASSSARPGLKGTYTRTEVNAATNAEQKGAGPFVEEPNRNFSLMSIMCVCGLALGVGARGRGGRGRTQS